MPADRDDGFGRFLEGFLTAWGVSRDELCEAVPVDPSMLSKEFSGVREIPKKKLVRYMEAAAEVRYTRKSVAPQAERAG